MTRSLCLILATLGLIIGGIFALGFLDCCRVPAGDSRWRDLERVDSV